MKTKKCARCKKIKPTSEFSKNRCKDDGLQTACKICKREMDKRLYYESDTRKKAIAEKNKEMKQRNRKFILEYLLNHPCVDCGESNPLFLDFDHVRGKKKYNVSAMWCNSIKMLKKEIAKCAIRCLKCHRVKTAKELKWHWAEEYMKEYIDAVIV